MKGTQFLQESIVGSIAGLQPEMLVTCHTHDRDN